MPEPVAAPVIADEVLAAVAEGRHSDPHSVLGQHGFDVAKIWKGVSLMPMIEG